MRRLLHARSAAVASSMAGLAIAGLLLPVTGPGTLSGGDPDRFTPPDREVRAAAIGDTRYLAGIDQVAFRETASFEAKRKPREMDWLAHHREPGQTFDQFLRSRRNLLQRPRTVLYLQPLGKLGGTESGLLKQVATFGQIFFQTTVISQQPLGSDGGLRDVTRRHHPGPDDLQFLSTDILELLRRGMPDDAYARVAVTTTDLYPEASWNFVFGQASLRHRVGVYSFARYGKPGTEQFLRRCLQVFAHETGHMFGIAHCIHYECLMNGSNNLRESDAAPLFLCPVCLRKLHAANAFDIADRYRLMLIFLRRAGLDSDAEWLAGRLQELPEAR